MTARAATPLHHRSPLERLRSALYDACDAIAEEREELHSLLVAARLELTVRDPELAAGLAGFVAWDEGSRAPDGTGGAVRGVVVRIVGAEEER